MTNISFSADLAPSEPVRPLDRRGAATFLVVGPVVAALLTVALMFAFDPSVFADRRLGCETVEGEFLGMLFLAWLVGLGPVLPGVAARGYARSRGLDSGRFALGFTAALAISSAMGFLAVASLANAPPARECVLILVPAWTGAILVGWTVADRATKAHPAA